MAAELDRPPPEGTVQVMCEVKARWLATALGNLVGHAADERGRGAAFLFAGLERVERKLEGGVALRGHAHDVRAVGAREPVDGDVERGGDDMAALMVRVVAGDLGAAGRMDVERLGAHRPEGVLEQARDMAEKLGRNACCHDGSFLRGRASARREAVDDGLAVGGGRARRRGWFHSA